MATRNSPSTSVTPARTEAHGNTWKKWKRAVLPRGSALLKDASVMTISFRPMIRKGSDFPYVAPQALIGAKKSLESRLASHRLDTNDVLSNNAARLFGNKL